MSPTLFLSILIPTAIVAGTITYLIRRRIIDGKALAVWTLVIGGGIAFWAAMIYGAINLFTHL